MGKPFAAKHEHRGFTPLEPENLGQGPYKHRMGIPAETVMDSGVFREEPNPSMLAQFKLLTKRQGFGLRASSLCSSACARFH